MTKSSGISQSRFMICITGDTINGLNSRGLLMAPLLSDWLVDSIIEGGILPSEVSIGRFFSAPLD